MRVDDATKACLAVRAAFLPTEDNADQMLAHLGCMLTTAATQRIEARIDYALPQNAVEGIGHAITGMIQVRQTIAVAHASFAAVARELRPNVAVGDDGCPGYTHKPHGNLSVVEAA